jgi:hypothetical protein
MAGPGRDNASFGALMLLDIRSSRIDDMRAFGELRKRTHEASCSFRAPLVSSGSFVKQRR